MRFLTRARPQVQNPPEWADFYIYIRHPFRKGGRRQCKRYKRNAKSEESTTENLKGEAGIDSRTQQPAHSGFAVSKEEKHHQRSDPGKQKYGFLQQRGRRTSDPRHRPRRRSLHLWRHQPSGRIWKRQNGRYAYVW